MVKGYRFFNSESLLESLYAKFEDGRVYVAAHIITPNDSFNVPGRKWYQVDYVPDSAEYIGRYAAPTLLEDDLGNV